MVSRNTLPPIIIATLIWSSFCAVADRWGPLIYSIPDFEVNILRCDQNFQGKLDIPVKIDGLVARSIEREAFAYCKELTEIVLPESIEEIRERAFVGCESLASANIPDQSILGDSIFAGCYNLRNIDWPANIPIIPRASFFRCSNLKIMEFPKGVLEIGFAAFQESGLEEINLPEGMRKINEASFARCRNLISASIPASVDTIGDNAFKGCDSLTTIKIPKIYHSEAEANRIGLIDIWPNGFLVEDTDVKRHEDSLEIRLAPVITVKGDPGSAKAIEVADGANGPWKLWRVVVIASGGTSVVDLEEGSTNRFYRIR